MNEKKNEGILRQNGITNKIECYILPFYFSGIHYMVL